MLLQKFRKLKANIVKVRKERNKFNKKLSRFIKSSSELRPININENTQFDKILEAFCITRHQTKLISTTDLLSRPELLVAKPKKDKQFEYLYKNGSMTEAVANNLEDILVKMGFIDELFDDTISVPYCDDPEYQISTHFKLKDFIRSAAAQRLNIPNLPDEREFKNICAVAYVLEIIWEEFGPIRINSCFRSPLVNAAVGGSKSSDHMHGAAADISTPTDTESSNKKLYYCVKRLHENGVINTRQIIWEYGTSEGPSWVHVAVKHSYAPNLSANHIYAIGNKAGNAYLLNA